MRQAIKVLSALAVAMVVVLAVRAYAFTIYTVPTDISSQLRRGDRVLVNRLSRVDFRRGELMVFRAPGDVVGRVVAVPGDTIGLAGRRYVIPDICCSRCGCTDCKLYLVSLGHSETLVHKHQVVGRAVRLFHLPF